MAWYPGDGYGYAPREANDDEIATLAHELDPACEVCGRTDREQTTAEGMVVCVGACVAEVVSETWRLERICSYCPSTDTYWRTQFGREERVCVDCGADFDRGDALTARYEHARGGDL